MELAEYEQVLGSSGTIFAWWQKLLILFIFHFSFSKIEYSSISEQI